MSTTKMYGYLRPNSRIKLHEIADASDDRLAEELCWTTNDWRDDPEWLCVAIGHMTIEREPAEKVAADAVAALRQQQTEARAAFEARMVEIERQINSLLAITHEVTA